MKTSKPKLILFQGDSITDCGRCRENDDLGSGYPTPVSAALNAEAPGAYRFLNRGISGDKIVDVCARKQSDIFDIRPDYMSLLIGVNDVWHRLDRGITPDVDAFEALYDGLLREIRERLPATKLFLLEPFTLHGAATDDRPDQPDRYQMFSGAVAAHAARVRKLAERYEVGFVPLQSIFDEAVKQTAAGELLADGVHPTEQGHALICRAWLDTFHAL